MNEFFYRARFRLDHRWAPSHMSAYLDGELGPGRRTRMERHAGDCAECRQVLDGLRRMLGELHRLPPPAGDHALQIAASVRLRLREPPGPD